MLHVRYRCRWCGRLTSGCFPACQQPHKVEEVESCAFCAHKTVEERDLPGTYPDDPEVTQSILGLVMENPPSLDTVTTWTPGQRRAAEDWAGREHLVASDNESVERVRRPEFIQEEA
jgi:hypothetical protein